MTQQLNLALDRRVTLAHHDGATYSPTDDKPRLNAQTLRVFDLMKDGRWRTLREISTATGDGEASVSARLRDLRKDKFGGFVVERRHIGERSTGWFEYRVL
jgi:hypothetical protein